MRACMQGHTNSKSILRFKFGTKKKRKTLRPLRNHFPSQLRGWVFIPLVCTEIYKTLTPANPAATKTGKRTTGHRNVLPKHTNRVNYITVAQ